MKKGFICFLVFAFLAFSAIPSPVIAGGGGGCDSEGCNNVMYGIAIAGTLFIIFYLVHQKRQENDQEKTSFKETGHKQSPKSDPDKDAIQQVAVFRW